MHCVQELLHGIIMYRVRDPEKKIAETGQEDRLARRTEKVRAEISFGKEFRGDCERGDWEGRLSFQTDLREYIIYGEIILL